VPGGAAAKAEQNIACKTFDMRERCLAVLCFAVLLIAAKFAYVGAECRF